MEINEDTFARISGKCVFLITENQQKPTKTNKNQQKPTKSNEKQRQKATVF